MTRIERLIAFFRDFGHRPPRSPHSAVAAAGYITIIDVFRELGIETDKHLTWAAGDIAQYEYAERHERQPIKDNRRKTNGGGSHCFALYPVEWKPRLIEIVRGVASTPSAQMDLFRGDDRSPQ